VAGPLENLWGLASAPELAPATSIVLGQIFAWSGTSKWLHPGETAQALVGFHVLRVPRRRAALALAGGELALAALLLAGPPVGGALMAGALLVASLLSVGFVVTIAAALRRPDRFPCMCFGASDAPLSAATLARGVALVVVTSVAAVSALGSAELLGARDWLLWNVVGAGALSCLAVVSRLPRLLRFDDPFDFSERVMLEPTGFGPITHDHD